VSPDREFGGEPYLTVKEALDRAAARINERFKDQPLVEAAIRTAIGQAYNSLNEHRLAADHLERAVVLRRTHLGLDHHDTLVSMTALAGAYEWSGRCQDAIALCQQILDSRQATLGPDGPKTLACVSNLADAYKFAGQWDTAIHLLEPLVDRQRGIRGPNHADTLGSMQRLAICYTQVGRIEESMALHEKLLELSKATIGPEHPNTLWCMRTFAQTCQRAGKLGRADRLLHETLELERRQQVSPRQRNTMANTLGWLAVNLLLQHRPGEAEPLAREAVAMNQTEQGRHFYWMSVLGAALVGQQKYAEAEPLLLQGYEGMKEREALSPAGEKRLLAEAGERIVRYYEATNQPDKARAWREKLRPAGRTNHGP
jgi:tetratricopeptide (TPR) repeat protein